jgi:hypothetical protein
MTNILLILILSISITGCEFFELERDNPLDTKSKNYNPQPEIIYYEYKLLDTHYWYSSKIEPGATVAIYIVLKNISIYDAHSITAEYIVNEDYVNVSSTISVIGDIFANSYSAEKENIVLTINQDTPKETIIPISMTLKDEQNKTWHISFNLTVK